MTEVNVPDEVLRLITGGSVKQGVEAFVRLAQRYVAELRALQVGDDSSVMRSAFIGREALSAGKIVFEQIQKETIDSGVPPLSEQEFRKMQRAMAVIQPEIVAALIRTTPGIFGEKGDQFLKLAENNTGLSVADLCAAYIRSAREIKRLLDLGQKNALDPLFNYLMRAILIALAMQEEIRSEVGLETKLGRHEGAAGDALTEAFFAKIASASATKAMKDFGLAFAHGGLQVDILSGDDAPVTLIRIPVTGDGSVARASSEMNSLISKVIVKLGSLTVPRGVIFSLRRVE